MSMSTSGFYSFIHLSRSQNFLFSSLLFSSLLFSFLFFSSSSFFIFYFSLFLSFYPPLKKIIKPHPVNDFNQYGFFFLPSYDSPWLLFFFVLFFFFYWLKNLFFFFFFFFHQPPHPDPTKL